MIADQTTASNVLGTLGAVCWSIQLIPQIIVNYRRHNTRGLQPSMMLLWASAGVPLGIYNILSDKVIALQIQPQILTSLSLVTWSQCMYYGHNWSIRKASSLVTCLGAFAAGVQLAVILGLKSRYATANDVPVAILATFAALAAAGLALGVLRHYWDIYTHRSVRGISFFFVAIDAAGDLFSLASVLVVQPIDIEGSVVYALEFVLWVGIMLCGIIFNLREWLAKRRSSATNSSDSGSSVETASSVFQTSAVSRIRTRLSQRLRLRAISGP